VESGVRILRLHSAVVLLHLELGADDPLPTKSAATKSQLADARKELETRRRALFRTHGPAAHRELTRLDVELCMLEAMARTSSSSSDDGDADRSSSSVSSSRAS
jgi:hypothetical protein